MPTNKQRRQAAQRRLQRQLERRAELGRRRRRNLLVGGSVVAVLLLLGAVWLIAGPGDDPADEAAAQPTGPASTCEFTPDGSGGDVGTPPADPPTEGTVQLTMTTNFGPLGLTLDRSGAPCAAASFAHLTERGFFDGTVCHRQTDSQDLRVLQCGDPTGSGTGGPGYSYPTDVSGDETYLRGTVAMANSGQGFDGSQFFLVWGDSQLPPDYTVVGTIDEAGLGVLDTIAANGNDASNRENDGRPTQEVRIESMTPAS